MSRRRILDCTLVLKELMSEFISLRHFDTTEMNKQKKKNQIAKSLLSVREPRKEKRQHVSLPKVSKKLAASLILDPTPPIPTTNITQLRIDELSNSVIAAHDREVILKQQTCELEVEKIALSKQVQQLQIALDSKTAGHHKELEIAKKKSYRLGHDEAAMELHKVWSSDEFAAELMYGELN